MKYRKLRIAWSAAWCVLAVLLSALWLRSYSWTDSVYGGIWGTKCFGASSTLGRTRIGFMEFGSADTSWGLRTTAVERERDLVELHQHEFCPGFGLIWDAPRSIIISPHWFLLLLAATLATAPWLFWQFSLRTLLIATTLVAAALGLVAWAAR